MRRALLIAYHFPPGGGVAVQRMLKFACHLPCFGYRPTVVTVAPRWAAYSTMDPDLLIQLPDTVDVVRTRAWDPFAVYAALMGRPKEDVVGVSFVKDGDKSGKQELARWIRGNIFLPDARLGWVPFARRTARKLVQAQSFAVVMTSGPPHSSHLVGSYLKKRCGIPWIADLRDPWLDYVHNMRFHQSSLARYINATLERRVLASADAVLSVSNADGRRLCARVALRRYETLPNGYDAHDLPSSSQPPSNRGPFVIAHVGTYARETHSDAFARVLGQLDPNIELRLVGHVHEGVVQSFRQVGIDQSMVHIPHVPHRVAMAHMAQAHMLLITVQRNGLNDGIITGKVFEYLATGRPILGIGPTGGDLQRLLRETRSGKMFGHDDAEGMLAFIQRGMQRRREGIPPQKPDPKALQAYDRRELTRQLAGIMDTIAPA